MNCLNKSGIILAVMSLVGTGAATTAAGGDAFNDPKESIGRCSRLILQVAANHSRDPRFPMVVEVYVDPEFSEDQIRLIRGAMEICLERITDPRLLKLAVDSSTRGLPKWYAPDQSARDRYDGLHLLAFEMFTIRGGGRTLAFPGDPLDRCEAVFGSRSRIYVSALSGGEKESVDGEGYVNICPVPKGWGREAPRAVAAALEPPAPFSIALNRDHMRGDRGLSDRDYWAGVIAHEFLHNLGYQHSVAGSVGYEQHFVCKFGEIVRNNGVGAHPLRDSPLSSSLMTRPISCGSATLR